MHASTTLASDAGDPLSRARWHRAIRILFFVLGMAMGVWGAQMPAVKQHYGLDEQMLSLALLAAAGGAVLCLLTAGALVARFGARHCVLAAGFVMLLAIAAVLQAQQLGLLFALMLLLGAGSALFDVAINAEGNALEMASPRKVMSGLHAMFSVGGMAGALLCAALHRGGVAPAAQLAGAALAMAAVLGTSVGALGSQRTDSEESPAPIAWPRGVLLWMGVLTALCMVAEGSMYDWSALFIRQELGTDAATSALGFAAFSAAMAVGRLFGDRIRERFSPVALMRGSGVLATAGMALALTTAAPAVALAGFMLVGLGLANVVPVMFAAAARVPGIAPAHGVAAVSSVGYLGFMVGPPMIGALARWSSLTAALWAVALFAVMVGAAARVVLERGR
ncbi:MAG: MFS transporter [Piscinibacter sp.]|uniref:MFS transporter n=1 Tax=Piscinibacter sp. TaxID=1903157 RepID=UPI003D0C1C23